MQTKKSSVLSWPTIKIQLIMPNFSCNSFVKTICLVFLTMNLKTMSDKWQDNNYNCLLSNILFQEPFKHWHINVDKVLVLDDDVTTFSVCKIKKNYVFLDNPLYTIYEGFFNIFIHLNNQFETHVYAFKLKKNLKAVT